LYDLSELMMSAPRSRMRACFCLHDKPNRFRVIVSPSRNLEQIN
jgi:hypothetical protein